MRLTNDLTRSTKTGNITEKSVQRVVKNGKNKNIFSFVLSSKNLSSVKMINYLNYGAHFL